MTKSVEFKRSNGAKVKVTDIPMLPEQHSKYFFVQLRLQCLFKNLYEDNQTISEVSFRTYLKQRIKWKDYVLIYEESMLKNNA
ncbi:DUF2535 family protein [Mangrovibacillus cuniculi]|uniref:DUF2535 family protein n=1 Tax=Mangrovibacillus cuniculi TaxID=2593652 RepID=UPI001EFA163A|nr:DUF2535 family protein [Mangrovibacillus cuniculi]